MAKFFLVLTIIAAGIAAGLGYVTYTKIADVKKTITEKTTELKNVQGELSKTKFSLKDAQDQLTATKTQLDTANEQVKTVQAKVDEATAQVTTVQGQLDAANKKIADQKTIIDGYQHTGTNGPVQNPTDPGVIIAQQKAQIDELTLLKQTLQAKVDEDDKRVQKLIDQENIRQKKISQPGLQGMVMAVNQGWGFVVISIGDRQGALPNAEVIVKRGDTLIAKLKITTVEPSTSIADIIPDSLAKGQRVLPGDQVIFSGNLAQ